MNKYELALVVSAKIEDDARTATVEKAKEYITRAGGTVTEVEEWGKKKLAYDVQKMSEAFYYFIQFDAASDAPAPLGDGAEGAPPKSAFPPAAFLLSANSTFSATTSVV